MRSTIASEMLVVIRSERDRRIRTLSVEDPDYADDQWRDVDEPFINELCLMVLVAVRHQLERELIRLAARVTDDCHPMGRAEFAKRLAAQRKAGWKSVIEKLNLNAFPTFTTPLKTLQLLANAYKHEPGQQASDELLTHLKISRTVQTKPVRVTLAPLPESRHFREALAVSIGMPKDADYCAIAEKFIACVGQLLEDVEGKNQLSPWKPEPVSLTDFVG